MSHNPVFATRVPICVWLDRQYPHSRPHCYVEQSSTADIGNGKHVDAGGLVHLQYLAEWKYVSLRELVFYDSWVK